jgi:FkbM family methyltransferase
MKALLKTIPGVRTALDIRNRLIHIEDKIDRLTGEKHVVESENYVGHSDQAFGSTTYAQSGEDLIALNTFALLGIQNPRYLDIGANHPWHCSNTALFYKRGCSGVAVDADPDIVALYRKERPNDLVLHSGVSTEVGKMPFYRLASMSGRNTFAKEMVDQFQEVNKEASIQETITVKVTTINMIVETLFKGRWPDFLSLDIEGLDERVLAATDFSKGQPAILCVENRNGRGDDLTHQVAAVAVSKGFKPWARTWANAIFLSEGAHSKLVF